MGSLVDKKRRIIDNIYKKIGDSLTNKKTLIVSVLGILLFTVAVATVSFAFYTANIKEFGNNNEVKGSTAKLMTTFGDTEIITITNMLPGDYFSKTFSLENNGDDIQYKIVVNELVNEFESFEDITYVLKENNIVIKEGTFPKEIATNEISDTLTLKNGERKIYDITITYQNTEENQEKDMGKTISGKIFIEEI